MEGYGGSPRLHKRQRVPSRQVRHYTKNFYCIVLHCTVLYRKVLLYCSLHSARFWFQIPQCKIQITKRVEISQDIICSLENRFNWLSLAVSFIIWQLKLEINTIQGIITYFPTYKENQEQGWILDDNIAESDSNTNSLWNFSKRLGNCSCKKTAFEDYAINLILSTNREKQIKKLKLLVLVKVLLFGGLLQ